VTHFTFHIIVNLRRIICVFLSVIVYIFINEKNRPILSLFKFVDKDNVHKPFIENLLIGVEGAQTPPKMLQHIHRA